MEEARLKSAKDEADRTARTAAAKAASDAAAMEETRLKSVRDEAEAAAKKAADDDEAPTVAHKAAAYNAIAAALVTPAPADSIYVDSWAVWDQDSAPAIALHAAPAIGADPAAHAIINAADMVHAAPAADAAAMEEARLKSAKDEADAAAKKAADDE